MSEFQQLRDEAKTRRLIAALRVAKDFLEGESDALPKSIKNVEEARRSGSLKGTLEVVQRVLREVGDG